LTDVDGDGIDGHIVKHYNKNCLNILVTNIKEGVDKELFAQRHAHKFGSPQTCMFY